MKYRRTPLDRTVLEDGRIYEIETGMGNRFSGTWFVDADEFRVHWPSRHGFTVPAETVAYVLLPMPLWKWTWLRMFG